MTTQTEALNIAIDYMNERLEEHDAKYQRHPATEAERNNILADIEIIKEALAQQEGQSNYCLQCEALSRELAALKAQQSNEQVEPVAIVIEVSKVGAVALRMSKDVTVGTRLYTHPPVPTAQPKDPLVINSQEKASEFIEKTLWEVIDVAAMFPKAKPNPRTWEHLMVYSPQPKEPEQNLKLMPREATPEMLKAMDECSMEGYDERLYEGHASSVYMAAWDAFHGQHCYCGDITNLGVIHRDDDPCHYPEHTSEYKRGYADAMNWKVQNHLEHLREEVKNCHPIIKNLQKKREFVGLTDEEFQLIYDMGRTPAGMMEMVEAKIKEKNT